MESMDDQVVSRIRKKLNGESVKLWLPPFTVDDKEGTIPDTLVARYATELQLDPSVVLAALKQLRSHALAKLAANRKYQSTGLATLRVRIINSRQEQRKDFELIEVVLQDSGWKLREIVASMCGVDPSMVKLISGGRVIQNGSSLQDQGIRHNGQLMALVLVETADEARDRERQEVELNKIREDAGLLSSVDSDDPSSRYYMQIADQSGKPINLPLAERKALGVAMVLHEKGRAALKRKKYSEALPLLLEADKEFRTCNSELLTNVDNYALLCLDIAWCYLSLRSVDQLFDAEARLKECENGFRRSYGENLERLTAIKGGSNKEAALFCRLHLLQGIVAFHQEHYSQARQYLQKAATLISQLKLHDSKLAQVMAMGFSESDSRLALRSVRGDVDLAVQHIITRQDEKKAQQEKEQEKRKLELRKRRLGKTCTGEWVSVENYDALKAMGFPATNARHALQRANNDINVAIQILQQPPQQPSSATSGTSVASSSSAAQSVLGMNQAVWAQLAQQSISTDMWATLTRLGIDLEVVCEALYRNNGDVDATLSELLGDSENADDEKERDAMQRLAHDIAVNEEDFLDVSLDEEFSYLKEYEAKLASLGH